MTGLSFESLAEFAEERIRLEAEVIAAARASLRYPIEEPRRRLFCALAALDEKFPGVGKDRL